MKARFLLAVAAIATTLAGCEAPKPIVHQPMSAAPDVRMAQPPANGAIFQTGFVERPLFEDRRARAVGDTLTVFIVEKNNASKGSKTNLSKSSALDVGIPLFTPSAKIQGFGAQANSSQKFDGQGASASNNDFTGTVTVTVVEVLPNGNMLVSGEKQVAINQGTEFIRVSGVVNPIHITSNTVSSTQLADARIEWRQDGGIGGIDSAQVAGWLTRFFFSFLPF